MTDKQTRATLLDRLQWISNRSRLQSDCATWSEAIGLIRSQQNDIELLRNTLLEIDFGRASLAKAGKPIRDKIEEVVLATSPDRELEL